jgi:hypothetical protein
MACWSNPLGANSLESIVLVCQASDVEIASNLNLVLSGIASIVIGNAMVIMIKMTKKRMTAAPIALLTAVALGSYAVAGQVAAPSLCVTRIIQQ